MIEEERRLALERVAQRLVEIGEALGVGHPAGHVAEVQPLPAEVVDEGLHLRVGQHSGDLAGQHVRLPELAPLGQSEELVVRDAAPEKEGQPRCQVDVREAVHRAGRRVLRGERRPEEEAGRDEHAAERHLDPVFEPCAVTAADREQLEQRVDIGRGDGAPVGAAGEPGQDSARARLLRLPRGRPADEDAPAGLGVAGAGRLERSADQDVVDGVAVRGAAVLALRVLGQEPRRDLVLAGRKRQPQLEVAGQLALFRRVEVGVEEPDPPAVDAEVEPGRGQPGRPPPAHAHRDRVVGVEREIVAEQEAAPLVRRQPVDRHVGGSPRRFVPLNDRPRRQAAHRQSTDAAGGGDVLLDVQRRDGQHVADVVEAVARVVRRQVARVVEVEPQDVADRVAVLGAVQPVDGRRPGVRIRCGYAVERTLEPRHEAGRAGGVRARATRGRHLARPKLLENLLEDGGLLADVCRVQALERQARGEGPVVVARKAVAADGGIEQLRPFRCGRALGSGGGDGQQAYQRRQPCGDAGGWASTHSARSVAFDPMRKRLWIGALSGWVSALLLVAVPAPAQTVEAAPHAASALFEAVQRRDASAVASLLAGGADVNATRLDGSTPLTWAALRDADEIVAALLQAGADPNAADENGEMALLFACGNGSLAIARMLLDAGAAVDAVRWSGDTPLLAAVHAGNEELARLLVERGAALDAAERRMGQTPLMWAAAEGHTGIARFLIGAGADVDASSARGAPPILFAAASGDADTAHALLAAGADAHVTAADGRSAFLIAAAEGNDAVTRLMLDHGADVNSRDGDGRSALHAVVAQGNVELVRELVARGADVHARTGGASGWGRTGGVTPFLAAAQAGNAEMMRALIALGADPTAVNGAGAGAVLLAARSRELDAVRLLVELGLDVNVHPPRRPSAFHTAIRLGDDPIVVFLADHGADFDALDQHGRTPLEEAEFEAPTHTIELMRGLVAERAAGKQ